MEQMIKAAWQYRFFILSSVKNDLRVRFIRSKPAARLLLPFALSSA